VTAASSNVKKGATATFTLVVHAEPAPRGAPAICNTVTVASTTADSIPWNNSATSTTQVKGSQADLAVTMTPEPIAADGNLTYTMVVTNNGPDGASATLNDALPPGATFVSLRAPADWLTITPAVGSVGTVTATTPTLANGATGRFALVVHVDPAAPGGPTIRNTAAVASTTTDPIPGNNSATVTTPIATATTTATKAKASGADVAVTMTGSPDTVVGNTNLTYTILVTNSGPDDADVTLTDALPPAVTLVSWSLPPDWEMTPPAPGGSGTVTATNPTLAKGATATLTLVVRVEPTARAGSTIRNAATVASTTGDPKPENNIAATTTPVQESRADLAVTQTASPDPVLPGNDLSYSIVVVNNGPGDAATVTLNDALPPGVSFVSFDVPAGWRTTTPAVGGTGTVTASNSTVANGDTATFTLVVRVDPAAAGGSTISNTATVASETSDPMSDNNSATATTQVKGSQADLAVVMTALPDPVAAGSDVTYAIVVRNNGPDDAAGATLIDPLPPGTTVISFTASSGWASSAPVAGAVGTVTATVVSLPNGASAMFRLIVRVNPVVPSGSTIANTATVSATAPDPTAANNSATATITTARP
jgi:uncharacterized repeat protein (TIGR01451 family)